MAEKVIDVKNCDSDKCIGAEKAISFSIDSLLSPEKTLKSDNLPRPYLEVNFEESENDIKRENDEVVSTSGDFYQRNYQDGKFLHFKQL